MLYQTLKTYAKLLIGRGVFRSYSQNGEDAIVHSLLRSVQSGFYVDVGAYHPTLYSNTYGLYKGGWRGVVIDPNETMQPLFKALRPRDVYIVAGVGRTEETKTYYVFNDGAFNTFDLEEAKKRMHMQYPTFLSKKEINVFPLNVLLKKQNVSQVDFLNIDIEGMDIEALKSYPWSMPPRIIAIESHAFNPDKPAEDPSYRFLREKGYVLRGIAAYTLVFEQTTNDTNFAI